MIKGTIKIRKVVMAIQATFPVLQMSFLETKAASRATCLPLEMMVVEVILERMLESALEADRLSGRETMPRLGLAAMVYYEGKCVFVGRFLFSSPNIGDSSKVNGEVKGDDPKSDDPQGTSPIIIPGSKEDQESTREIETAFNASDTSIRAGKGKDADIPILVTPQEGERTLPSGNSTQDKNVIEEGKGADSVNSEMAPALDNIICNSLKKIRVTNKRKREENEWKVQSLPTFVCPSLGFVLNRRYVVDFGFVPGFYPGLLCMWFLWF
ncbi:hypothetical protein V6N13_128152 [Hibiscus sabdariffa]|uniref:Uncharacterized protein n=1 Tax=Hibiscus sabdariffa TaxID=183260 RepID=A0ABR2AL95_9ROSI